MTYGADTAENHAAAMLIGLRVWAARMRREWTQAELCRRTLVPQSYLSRIENGRSLPQWQTLELLAQALGVKLSDLVA